MTKNSQKWRGFMLVGALVGALTITGCKPATTGSAGGGARDDLLAHLPADCATGRVFLDWRSIAHHPAFAGHLQALEDKAAHAMGSEARSEAREALASLRRKGLDPARDVESVGMCIRAPHSGVVGISGDFEDKDLLQIFRDLAREKSGEEAAPPHDVDGIKYMGDADTVLAQVVPRVLILDLRGEPEDLLRMADRIRVAKDWRAAEGTMVWASIDADAKTKLEMSVRADGDDLVIDTEVTSDELASATTSALRHELDKLADELAATPLAPLAEDVRAMDVKASGGAVRAHLVAPSAHVSKTIEALLRASDADLQRGFRM